METLLSGLARHHSTQFAPFAKFAAKRRWPARSAPRLTHRPARHDRRPNRVGLGRPQRDRGLPAAGSGPAEPAWWPGAAAGAVAVEKALTWFPPGWAIASTHGLAERAARRAAPLALRSPVGQTKKPWALTRPRPGIASARSSGSNARHLDW